ncbi:hypothetical protein [Thiothrix nivea]|uniref:Uncharacterized protein n=1 Tax=Thiothrix nivea (strain ATCC 35100 / DSM 5205 / JP2) TaxID=870187 RepID=A0A656HBL5_THINJ|nr:hypothetical protein [Thiothrix nivea]EIJ33364.1 hypothetical protein Thini_0727 [Thiothrix nivea DSM 5205]
MSNKHVLSHAEYIAVFMAGFMAGVGAATIYWLIVIARGIAS